MVENKSKAKENGAVRKNKFGNRKYAGKKRNNASDNSQREEKIESVPVENVSQNNEEKEQKLKVKISTKKNNRQNDNKAESDNPNPNKKLHKQNKNIKVAKQENPEQDKEKEKDSNKNVRKVLHINNIKHKNKKILTAKIKKNEELAANDNPIPENQTKQIDIKTLPVNAVIEEVVNPLGTPLPERPRSQKKNKRRRAKKTPQVTPENEITKSENLPNEQPEPKVIDENQTPEVISPEVVTTNAEITDNKNNRKNEKPKSDTPRMSKEEYRRFKKKQRDLKRRQRYTERIIAKKNRVLKFKISEFPPMLPQLPEKQNGEVTIADEKIKISTYCAIVIAKNEAKVTRNGQFAGEKLPKVELRQKNEFPREENLPKEENLTSDFSKEIQAGIEKINSVGDKNPKLKVVFGKIKPAESEVSKSEDDNTAKSKKNKKKKKEKVNKFEVEAIAAKEEVIELPPIGFIKTTFPEEAIRAEMETQKARITIVTAVTKEAKLDPNDSKFAFAHNMVHHVKEILQSEFAVSEGNRILLAVSGGVDSMVMLHIFSQVCEELRIAISVAHFNHNLRGLSSDADEELVRVTCQKYGIKCYVGSEDILKYASDNNISIEEAARFHRYKMFERLSGNLRIDYVATAHNTDDSVETFFLNLMRGTGLTGLRGIPRKRHLAKSTFMIRPIIDFKKEDIYKYAKLCGLSWCEDHTNSIAQYTRNKIRLKLLPYIKEEFSPAIFDLINRTSKFIAGADEFIGEYVNNTIESIIRDRRKDSFCLSVNQLDTFSPFIKSEIVSACLVNIFKILPPGINTIERIINLKNSPSGASVSVTQNIYAARDRDNIIFAIRSATDSIDKDIEKTGVNDLSLGILSLTPIDRRDVKFTNNPNIEFLDADLLPAMLKVRNWKAGDKFKPLGMEGSMMISDFLINMKISTIDKRDIAVLTTKTDIVWVIGKRLSNDYKVTQTTRNVIKAEFIAKNSKDKNKELDKESEKEREYDDI